MRHLPLSGQVNTQGTKNSRNGKGSVVHDTANTSRAYAKYYEYYDMQLVNVNASHDHLCHREYQPCLNYVI